MEFKVDENLPVEVASLLQKCGHDAKTVRQEGLGGGKDEVIAGICLVVSAVARLVKVLEVVPLAHHLWIVEEESIRISGKDDQSVDHASGLNDD